jgi:PEP-CTERM motif
MRAGRERPQIFMRGIPGNTIVRNDTLAEREGSSAIALTRNSNDRTRPPADTAAAIRINTTSRTPTMRQGILPISNSALTRFAAIALVAAMLGTLSASNVAAAPITVVTAPFSGITTDLTSVGNQSLPFTDAFDRVISGTGFVTIIEDFGLVVNLTFSLTFDDLNPLTTAIGFNFDAFVGAPDMVISSATFSNGDTFTGPLSVPRDTFFGFVSTTPFTSVTFEAFAISSSLTDFRTAPAESVPVPEPSSLALIAFGVGLLSARKRLTSR